MSDAISAAVLACDLEEGDRLDDSGPGGAGGGGAGGGGGRLGPGPEETVILPPAVMLPGPAPKKIWIS
jgi:hypothetical protein